MHAKYEGSVFTGSKVIGKVNVFPLTNTQTGQKQDAPEFYSGGIKRQEKTDNVKVNIFALGLS